MNFIDTHAHLYSEKFQSDLPEVLDRCREQSVTQIYLPNIDEDSAESMLEIQAKAPEVLFSMMGLHPCYVKKDVDKQLYKIEDWFKNETFIGVGEIGLDLYWDKSLFEQQKEAFRIQTHWAKERELPIAIHSREANREAIDLVSEAKTEDLRGVFHCFSGTVAEAQEMIALGFFLGIGGVATFKNGGLDKVLPEIDLDHLVLETDSPYLAPVPYRGKRNESSYIPKIAQRIADIKGVSLEEVARVTTANAIRLFKSKSK